jgi:lysylphosphatidylglycerol synthetase-like protein (DUF2156 family)
MLERFELLRRHGRGSLAYSSLQPGMEFYFQSGQGYVPFSSVPAVKTPVVLGDPICAFGDEAKLLKDFAGDFIRPLFMHILRPSAEILQDQGFFINELGVETVIDLDAFTLQGKEKEYLRQQRNRATKDGVTVYEQRRSQVESQALRVISEEWIQKKAVKNHEMSFLVRPAIYEDEPDVRKFYAVKGGVTIGFVFFDPMYENEHIVGYTANILRSNCKEYSVTDFIILEAIEKFRAEGLKEISLGFSPFYKVDDTGEFKYSKPLKELFKYTYEHADYLYHFQSLAFHKTRYRPGSPGTREIKVYGATRSKLPLFSLYTIFLKMGIRPILQTAEHAAECAEKMIHGIPDDAKKFLEHWKHPHPDEVHHDSPAEKEEPELVKNRD